MSDLQQKEELQHVDLDNESQVSKLDEAVEENYQLNELRRIVGENREELEKKFLRKLDLRMMPMLMVIFVLNFLDRTNIGTARLGGLEKDTGLHGTQYNTIISIFYVGYLITQMFSNALLARVRPSLLLPGVMIAWATVSACCGAVQSYGGWVAIRLLLGFVESPYFAGALFLLSSWYTKKELALRISILFTASQLSNAFGGLIGQAILTRFSHDNRGVEAWRWLFIIEGSITVPVAAIAIFVLPDFPHNTKFFNEQESALAQLRILENASEEEDYDASMLGGFKSAFADPTLYLLWLMQLGLFTAATVNVYFPTIVGTLGYDRTKTLLLTAPPWFFSAFFSLAVALNSDRVNERYKHIMFSLGVSLVGFIIAASTMKIGARYFSMFLMLACYGGSNCILSWVATCISRPPPKRAVSYGFVNAFSNLSSVYASYFYPSETGPRYLRAMILNIVFIGLAMVCATLLEMYLIWRNKKMDAANAEDMAAEGTEVGEKTKAMAKRFDCDPRYRFTL